MTSRSQAFLASIGTANSWGEIHAAWASKTEKEKGDRFEDLSKAYLQLAPEYASKLKHVWRLDEVPAITRKKLNLPATDKGIDLIAETHEGEFWAIQCKYRQNTDQQLTHTDISTFTSLTFQACKGISYALVCSTTERVTQLYRGEERIGFCALDTWQELDRDFFDRLRASLASKPVNLEPRKPRPHQHNAIRDGLEHFAKRKEARGKLIMPCGTGKSLTAWFLAQALGSKRIVIAVPSLSLVKQTLKVWLRESVANDIDVEWICACSDETAGKADQDDVVVQRQDIAVPCYTSTDKIADWLRTKHKGLTVVFTTYQSGDVLATAARKAKFSFDLGIMDEAHKTVGDGDKQFSILLHDHNIEIGQRVFMTATERRYKGSSDKVLSMDDAEDYGDTFHQLSFKQAMECQPPILCDYNVITIGVSRQEIKDLIKQNVFVRPTGGKWDEEMEADMLAAMVALRKAMKEHPIKHAVSFHGSIQRAELFKAHNDTFTREFPEFGGLETFHVSGQTPTGTRSNIIKAFAQAERSLVTNARCLTEGVDVPGIDCVLFADPRKSTVDIVQAVGRALRPSEGKKLGYVILPVLHETDATSEQVIDSGAFKEILTTISALASNDDRIIEYFRGISLGRKPSGSSRVSFEWDERLAKNIDLTKLISELEIKCWGRLAKLSWRNFEEAKSFARNLKLKSQKDWSDYCSGRLSGLPQKPADIPSNPQLNYARQGWVNFGDWLGTGNISPRYMTYMPFANARKHARSLKLSSRAQWTAYCKGELHNRAPKPIDIPSNPDTVYKDEGWMGMGDWLGTGNLRPIDRQYAPFTEARLFALSLNLNSGKEWRNYCKGMMRDKPAKPENIPADPNRYYKSQGWKGMGHWLGTGTTRFGSFMPFAKARAFARSLRLSSAKKWFLFCKGELTGIKSKPANIPFDPQRIYKDEGWINWGDWLGTGTVSTQARSFMAFTEARGFVHKLNLASASEWFTYCKGQIAGKPKKPDTIPTYPAETYKDKGWRGMRDWLGN
jgi:superfamily II DNA or RNA helicase